ncbi:hypothetical protein GCM10009637_18820 [Brevibacterium luteolum]
MARNFIRFCGSATRAGLGVRVFGFAVTGVRLGPVVRRTGFFWAVAVVLREVLPEARVLPAARAPPLPVRAGRFADRLAGRRRGEAPVRAAVFRFCGLPMTSAPPCCPALWLFGLCGLRPPSTGSGVSAGR